MDRGWPFATWPVLAKALSRWGRILLTVVLSGIGLVVFAGGHVASRGPASVRCLDGRDQSRIGDGAPVTALGFRRP
ncbi:hypothetical protein [Streptomyces sp. AGS-58]|uniref:hypothetical protein n=1 Tax=unclassified Streptomyces TaxID=2593676 RepID=UPI0035A38C2F